MKLKAGVLVIVSSSSKIDSEKLMAASKNDDVRSLIMLLKRVNEFTL